MMKELTQPNGYFFIYLIHFRSQFLVAVLLLHVYVVLKAVFA